MASIMAFLFAVAGCLSVCNGTATSETSKILLESYDFIIVGAGSAGSVLANRLSSNGKYTVLVLEAGDEMTDGLYVPFMAPFAANDTNSWGYKTDPQWSALLDFPGNTAAITQGKVLGGTSSLNSMNYVRGSPHDFNMWEKEYKATGWNYKDVLKFFIEIENFMVPGVSKEEHLRLKESRERETENRLTFEPPALKRGTWARPYSYFFGHAMKKWDSMYCHVPKLYTALLSRRILEFAAKRKGMN